MWQAIYGDVGKNRTGTAFETKTKETRLLCGVELNRFTPWVVLDSDFDVLLLVVCANTYVFSTDWLGWVKNTTEYIHKIKSLPIYLSFKT